MKTREAAVEIPKAVEVVRRAALAPEAVERWDEVLRQVDPVLPVLEHVLRVDLRDRSLARGGTEAGRGGRRTRGARGRFWR